MVNVLFLEDEPTIQEVLTEYMKLQQYDVTPVEDGEAAMKLLEKKVFDLAVLDINFAPFMQSFLFFGAVSFIILIISIRKNQRVIK